MSAKATRETATTLAFSFWLIFDRYGGMRFTRTEPATSREERKMYLTAELPKSLWASPELKGTITVTNDDREPEIVIDAQAASEALRGALGVDIDLVVHRRDVGTE